MLDFAFSVLESLLRSPACLFLAKNETGRKPLLGRLAALLVLCPALGMCSIPARAQNAYFKIPSVKIPIKFKDQTITITASGSVFIHSKDQDATIFKLELHADLGELQQNMTGLLGSQLDKDDACGERITIEHAELVPIDPASSATVQLHYERWACAKVFGKEKRKRLVGGDALIEVKLTPAIQENNTELLLLPEVGKIEADGSLGELLRSGSLGEMLRDKIRASILSAMEKGTDLSVTLPPAIQGRASIQNAEFKDGGSGRLIVVLKGEGRISREQIQELSKQIKERLASK